MIVLVSVPWGTFASGSASADAPASVCAAVGCATQGLYFHSSTKMDGHEGAQADPGHAVTLAPGSPLTRTTDVAPRPWTLARAGAFHVHLDGRQALHAGRQNTTVDITLLEASGASVTLAHATFSAVPQSAGDPGVQNAITALRQTAGALSPVLSSPGPAVLNATDALCGSPIERALVEPQTHPCDSWNGSVYLPFLGVRACDDHQPSVIYRTLAQQIHDKPPCAPSANKSARDVVATAPGTPPVDPVGPTPADDVFAPPTAPGENWTDLTLDALQVPAYATGSDGLTLPAGSRLQLRVHDDGATGPAGSVPTSTFFEDAPRKLSRLDVRVAAASVQFLDADPIAPGTHSGAFVPGTHVDARYSFQANAGQAVRILPVRGALAFDVLDPRGRTLYEGTPQRTFVASESGTWLLRVHERTPTAGTYDAYAFELLTLDLPAQDDAGSGRDAGDVVASAVRITPGAYAGHLDELDTRDVFVLYSLKYAKVVVDLTTPDGANFSLDLVDATGRALASATQRGFDPQHTQLIFYADAPGDFDLAVGERSGRGTYALTVTVIGGADPTALPGLSGRIAIDPLTGITSDGHGGVFLASETNVRDYDGSTLTLRLGRPARSLVRTASGSLISFDYNDGIPTLRDLDSGRPIGRGYSPEFFLPTGELVHGTWSGFVATDAQRHSRALNWSPSFSPPWELPNGTLCTIEAGSPSCSLDGATYRPFTFGWWLSAGTADASASLYFATYDGLILRSDGPEAWTPLAKTAWRPVALLTSATRLYVVEVNATTGDFTVGWLDLGRAGFDGYHPAFDALPAPDLAITSLRVERDAVDAPTDPLLLDWGFSRNVSVTVTNHGEAATYMPIPIEVYKYDRLCFEPTQTFCLVLSGGPLGNATVAGLAPGESVTVTIPWDTRHDVGRQELFATVDRASYRDNVESNESDNTMTTTSPVLFDSIGPVS